MLPLRNSERHWETTLTKLARGDIDTMEAALWSQARARNDALGAELEGVPVDGPIHGVRAVLTGHTIVDEVTVTENVWHIDTGAGNQALPPSDGWSPRSPTT